MTRKMTRAGALNVTNDLDKLATLVQEDHAVLGIPEKIAVDFAYRCDLLSDAIEKMAAANEKVAEDEEGESVEAGQGGFDPNAIADEVAGPHEGDSDESYMSDQFQQDDKHELGDRVDAGDLASVDKLAAALRRLAGRPEEVEKLVSRLASEDEDEDEDEDEGEEASKKASVHGYNLFA